MGLSGSKKTTTENSKATTVPNVPSYALPSIQDYYGKVGQFGQTDPYSLIAPNNSLQQQAGASAAGLGTSPLFGQAASAINMTAGAPQINAPSPYNVQQASVAPMMSANTYNPSSVSLSGYNAPQLGQASQVSMSGYNAPQLGQAATYNAPQLGQAAQAGPASQYLSPNASQMQAESLLTGFNNYLNPATGALVDATLAGFDANAGRVRQSLASQAAGAGAFGGSRLAIAQAQTEADLARERAGVDAGLRSAAWNNAAALSQYDTGNRQQAGLANMQANNQRAELLGQLGSQTDMFNAEEYNRRGLAQGQLTADAARFNAEEYNRRGLAQGQLTADAARFGAEAGNQGALANQQAQTQYDLAQGQLQADAARFGAEAGNQGALANQQAYTQAASQNAEAQNAIQQQYMAALNDALQFNAGQGNQAASQVYGTEAQIAQQNAQLQQQQQAQNNQAAGMLADIAAQEGSLAANNAQTQAQIGQMLWQAQQLYAMAPAAFMEQYGNAIDPALLQAITGQTITSQGTTTQKSSGGILGALAGIGSIFS